ncbi:MAG TPA: CvpA family protein [Spirochaetales bacterium]|nr:CvpA family protein [Spirochaetales bacterium]
MNTLDLVLGALILLLGIRAAFRGFVTEALSVAAPFIAGWAAVALFESAAGLIRAKTGMDAGAGVISFAAIFIFVFVVVKVLEGIIDRALEAANLDQLDRLLGFVLGLAEGALLAALAVIVLERQPFFELDAFLSGSWTARFLAPLIAEALPAGT